MSDPLSKFLFKKFQSAKSAQHYEAIFRPYLTSGFSPPHALSEVVSGDEQKFWAGFWEAMLYLHFNQLNDLQLDKSHISKSGQMGPDFRLLNAGQTIWVEAIAPSPMDIPLDWLEAPKLNEYRVRSKPHDAILLRWTSAIKEKRRAFSEYKSKQIIAHGECTVIAISSSMLHDYAFEDKGASQLPTAIEAVFPIGLLAISIDPSGKLKGEAVRMPRFQIQNKNNSAVPTDNFLNPAYSNISALMGSHRKDSLGGLDAVLIHNPYAVHPLPKGILGAALEYEALVDGEYFTLKRI